MNAQMMRETSKGSMQGIRLMDDERGGTQSEKETGAPQAGTRRDTITPRNAHTKACRRRQCDQASRLTHHHPENV